MAEAGRSPTGAAAADGAGAPPVLRWHAKRKAEVVLRLLRGAPLDALSRELSVPLARLEQWRDEGLAGLKDALQARASDDPLRLKLDEANRRIGELSMEVELLRGPLREKQPLYRAEVEAMSGATSPATGGRYGVERVCSAWGCARSTYYAQAPVAATPASPPPPAPRKRGPKTALSDEALLALIRADLAASPFTGEGHRKVHARLRHVQGHRVGHNRVRRLMREHRLLSPHRGRPAPAKTHDGRISTDAPNQRWATDGAKIWTSDEGWVWLFTTVEHWNGECLGHHVAKVGHRFAAYEPVAQAVTRRFGRSAAEAARGVELRHDHGSQYLTDCFQNQARFHGFTASFALVGEPETNSGVARFTRTLKEQIIHGRTYRTGDELRRAVTTFVATYDAHWRLEKLGFQSPLEARQNFKPSSSLAA